MRRPSLIVAGVFLMLVSGGLTLMIWDYLGIGYTSRGVLWFGFGLFLVVLGSWPERPIARVSVGAGGLAAALYGTACLTGGWLGTPPWHRRTVGQTASRAEWLNWGVSLTLILVGVGLVVIAAWPRYADGPRDSRDLWPPGG